MCKKLNGFSIVTILALSLPIVFAYTSLSSAGKNRNLESFNRELITITEKAVGAVVNVKAKKNKMNQTEVPHLLLFKLQRIL